MGRALACSTTSAFVCARAVMFVRVERAVLAATEPQFVACNVAAMDRNIDEIALLQVEHLPRRAVPGAVPGERRRPVMMHLLGRI